MIRENLQTFWARYNMICILSLSAIGGILLGTIFIDWTISHICFGSALLLGLCACGFACTFFFPSWPKMFLVVLGSGVISGIISARARIVLDLQDEVFNAGLWGFALTFITALAGIIWEWRRTFANNKSLSQ